MHRSTALVLDDAAELVDRLGLARGRFTDSAGRLSVEGAIQSALHLRGGNVRDHARTYGDALGLVEDAVEGLGFRPPPGRQAVSAWSDQADTEAAVVLLREAADLAAVMAGVSSPADLRPVTTGG